MAVVATHGRAYLQDLNDMFASGCQIGKVPGPCCISVKVRRKLTPKPVKQ